MPDEPQWLRNLLNVEQKDNYRVHHHVDRFHGEVGPIQYQLTWTPMRMLGSQRIPWCDTSPPKEEGPPHAIDQLEPCSCTTQSATL